MIPKRAREIIEATGYGFIASSVSGQARVRPMAFVISEEGTLWSSTYKQSGKVGEFQDNDRVEICFLDGQKHHLRLQGKVSLTGGPAKKRRLLEVNPKVGRHFSGPEDPNYVHVEILPVRFKWKAPGFSEYEEAEA